MAVRIVAERPLGAEVVFGTVLFADLRGYTTLAERLPPAAVVTLLEEFFGVLARAVDAADGTVFHSAGDSLMAGFGLSNRGTAPMRAAVAAGRRMVAAFGPVAATWTDAVGVVTGIGVGVHAGELAHATLGPPAIRRATLIGDTVNVAARLCQRARAGEVLFSAEVATALEAGADGEIVRLPRLALRGRETPIDIFCVPARERLIAVGQPLGA